MKFELLLSLREIAAIKVATILWNCVDRRRIKACLTKYRNLPLNRISVQKKLLRIEDKVKIKISEFEVPESLKNEVANLVKPLGIEILKWCKYHCMDGYIDVDIPKEFFWTSLGTIDLKKTAEVLVRDEHLRLTARYKLACIYCLEENITELWLKMSEDCRAIFYSSRICARLILQHELVTFWTLFKRGEIARMRIHGSTDVYAFHSAAVCGNLVATKFFCEKLTPKQKERSLVIAAEDVARKSFNHLRNHSDFLKEYYPEVLFFLLSQCDVNQQLRVCGGFAHAVLKSLLQWPFCSVLKETANFALNYTSDLYYSDFLKAITRRVLEGHRYYNYSELFRELWKKSTLPRKKYVASSPNVRPLINLLLKTRDTLNIKLIFDEMDLVEKKEYLYSRDGQFHCYELMNQNDWDFLRLFIQQCVPLREDLVKFKEKAVLEMRSYKGYFHLVNLLNRLICQEDKRKNTGDHGIPSKKHVGETEEHMTEG